MGITGEIAGEITVGLAGEVAVETAVGVAVEIVMTCGRDFCGDFRSVT